MRVKASFLTRDAAAPAALPIRAELADAVRCRDLARVRELLTTHASQRTAADLPAQANHIGQDRLNDGGGQ